jgi:uncharacterized repeat protein (TIGR02543 family)
VAWGDDSFGASSVPAGLSNVKDIAAGGVHTAALSYTTGFAVTFDVKGGTPVPDVQTVAEGGTAIAPATAPTKAGFDFGGWYIDGETAAFDFATPINGDVTLSAKWIQSTDYFKDLYNYMIQNIANGHIKNIGNSLTVKLFNVSVKINRGDTGAAVNQLNAFINEVAVQKGKKIEAATADQLIQKAQQVIADISQV